MKGIIFDYIKKRKLLVALLGIYFLLSVFSTAYLYLNGDRLFASDSSSSLFTWAPGQNSPESSSQITSPNSSSPKVNEKGDIGSDQDPEPGEQSESSSSSGSNNPSAPSDGSPDSTPDSEPASDNDTNNLTATVAFYADTQEDTDAEDENHVRVANYILSTSANPVFHAGDILEDGTQNSLDRFNNASSMLRAARTFYSALGNNDRVVGDSSMPSSILLNFFNYPNNERWYSVNVGNLHLIVLDSAFASFASGSAQYNWLISDLESETAQSRIIGVMFHHPNSASQLASVFSAKHVDFVVTGHAHAYSRYVSDGVNYYVCSGQPSIGYMLAQVYEQNIKIESYNSSNQLIESVNIADR